MMLKAFVNNKQQFFDWWAPNYDFLFVSVFYQAIHKRLVEYVELAAQPNVLDLGCGTGRLLNRLATQFPDLRGTGLDISTEMLRQARRHNQHHPRLIYVQGNAEMMPFANEQFNAVFNTLSFLHYSQPEQVFLEVSRVLRFGGNFYLVDATTRQQTQTRRSAGAASSDAPVQAQDTSFFSDSIKLYSTQAREILGAKARLDCLGHHYLLGTILLTVFAKH